LGQAGLGVIYPVHVPRGEGGVLEVVFNKAKPLELN
jgi:hypothetical protein